MSFLTWYGIGVATIVLTLFYETYSDSRNIKHALKELYETLVSKAGPLSTTLLGLVSLFGPLLPFIFAYFIGRNWYDSLAEDEDGNKDYPWSND